MATWKHFDDRSGRDTPIWRYMDLVKFIALLRDRHLWFSRADKQNDFLEGDLAPVAIPSNVYDGSSFEFNRALRNSEAVTAARVAQAKTRTYMSCWHMNNEESMAMWAIYAAQGRGVAVHSTLGGLRDALEGDGDFFRLAGGPVRYGSRQIFIVNDVDPQDHWPFLAKRDAFKYEQEFRAIYLDESDRAEGVQGPIGLSFPVDLTTLIDAVYVAPGQDDLFGSVVKDLVKKYGLAAPVLKSGLDGTVTL